MPAPAPDRGRFAAVIALPGTRMPWLGCGMPPTSHLLAFALVSFALIFVAAVLQRFVDRLPGSLPAQSLLVRSTFVTIARLCARSWAVYEGTARACCSRSPRRLELVAGTGGMVMIEIGADLGNTGRHD